MREERVGFTLEDLTSIPRLMVYTSIAWFFIGGGSALTMVLAHLTGLLNLSNYYQLLTVHGTVMVFGGLFQLMVGLSLLRAGACYGRPVRGWLVKSCYLALNAGLNAVLVAVALGVRVGYTLMFPLPAVGALRGLWGLDALAVFVWGIIMILLAVIALYPVSLAKLIFFGKTQEALITERFMGTLNPSGMASMLPYIFVVPPLGSAITIAAVAIGLALLGAVSLQSIGWFIDPLNFNYPFWIFAHNLMEAMGIMALGTVYWLLPRYTAAEGPDGSKGLFSERLGLLAIVLYTSAATVAFPHHLFTMPTSQPHGLSYVGQLASWLTGFGAALSIFNVSATAYLKGLVPSPVTLATVLGFALYVVDGLLAMQLGTIGWAYKLHGTYAATAHLMTILIAVAMIWIGALYHSYDLLFKKRPSTTLAYAHILLTGIAGFGLFYTMVSMGVEGAIRRAYPMNVGDGPYMAAILAFGIILALAQVLFLYGLVRGKLRGQRAERLRK